MWAELFIIYAAGAVARRMGVHIAPDVVMWAELVIIYIARLAGVTKNMQPVVTFASGLLLWPQVSPFEDNSFFNSIKNYFCSLHLFVFSHC
jgi:hypothetical protein